MPGHKLVQDVREDGVLFELRRGTSFFGGSPGAAPFEEWRDDAHPGASLLRLMAQAGLATVSPDGVLVPHAALAELSLPEAAALQLPSPCPYALRLESKGALADERFSVVARWIGPGGSRIDGLRRNGCELRTASDGYMLRQPLFGLLDEIERLNSLDECAWSSKSERLDARMVQLGRVKRALELATGDASADRYLGQLTICHATGVGLDVIGTRDNPSFRPTLYGDVPRSPGAADNEDGEVERQPLLPDEQARSFGERQFPAGGARSHYRLGDGSYVVVDKAVTAALGVASRINGSDVETRKRFRRDPASYLLPEVEAAGGDGGVLCGGTALAADELSEYGDRVIGVAEWEGRAFSFRIPVHQQWFAPEGEDPGGQVSTIEIPGAERPLVVRAAELDGLIAAVAAAALSGDQAFRHGGESYPLSDPDTLLTTLRGLTGSISPDPASGRAAAPSVRRHLVLRVAENEEDLSYLARLRDPDGRLSGTRGGDVAGLRSVPDPHQRDAIGWLQACFLSGMPGALLADDMGLGKTFEVLAFLHWLRTNHATDGRPVLVCAPSKLLEEWKEQIGIHLPEMAMGRPVYAYGQGLADCRVERGREADSGRAALDVGRLQAADWVLTTYETLRDNQFSFAKVRFRIAVFDEAQKIKSGSSMLNHAAKAQQPDFTVLMTGTPVENSIMDLWTLLDVGWPGLLGMSGKDFIGRYGDGSDVELMEGLKKRVVEQTVWGEGAGARTTPPVMLRRFKSDILIGLPPKQESPAREEMPPAQAKAYDAILGETQRGSLKPLAALQALRKVCLHHDMRPPRSPADRRALIDGSARYRALFRILREARQRDRAVLVFVDLRSAQDMLRPMIRDELGLGDLPDVINGNTAPAAVADIKARFQAGRGFGVLLLGPRSAGFGLTLTRATEVVHLNRWWNPAVEDQCSDRTHRKGQTEQVTVHLPIAIHPRLGDASFDVILDELLRRKRSQSRQVVVPSSMSEAELAEFFARLATPGQASGLASLADLDRRDWRSFEVWVEDCFKGAGWQVSGTPRAGDAGADVIGRHPAGGRPVVIQVKHRAMGVGQLGEEAVREVARAPGRYRRSHPWLERPMLLAVSNGAFDLRAQTLARQTEVRIVDRAEIVALGNVASELLQGGRS